MARNNSYTPITGAEQLHSVLAGLPEDLRREILATTMGKAGAHVAGKMRRKAPRVTGALAKSITYVVRKYGDGARTISVVGPNRKYVTKDGARPANYAHLVEFGHRVAKGGALDRLDGRGKAGTGKQGGFVPAKPFMRPGLIESQASLPQVMLEGVQKGMDKAIAKRVRAGTHKR